MSLVLRGVELGLTMWGGGPYYIFLTTTRFRDCMLALDAGHTVPIGNWVSTSVFDYGPASAPIGAQSYTGEGGGHCMFLHGYEVLPSGIVIWEGTNSWGTGWGRGGRFQCTSEFLKQSWEVFAMKVRVAQ